MRPEGAGMSLARVLALVLALVLARLALDLDLVR
jgi:hypothetical protein